MLIVAAKGSIIQGSSTPLASHICIRTIRSSRPSDSGRGSMRNSGQNGINPRLSALVSLLRSKRHLGFERSYRGG